MATAIALRRKFNNTTPSIQSHRFVKLLSSSSSSSSSSTSSNPKDEDENPTQSSRKTPISSYISEVRAKLKQQPPPPQQKQQQQRQPYTPFSTRLSTEKPPPANWQAIRESLHEFRNVTAAPPSRREKPSSSSSSPDISISELYKRKVMPEGEESSNSVPKGQISSFADIRERLRQKEQTTSKGGAVPISSRFSGGSNLKLRPLDPNQREPVKSIGGEQHNLPASVFRNEIGGKSAEQSSNNTKRMFVKMYSKKELGERLSRLRPEEAKGGNKGFSIGELNERLIKLREIEQKEYESSSRILPSFIDLRESLESIQKSEDETAKKSITHRLEVLSQIGGTPKFMLEPPQEHLLEKYFHPDNMSSAEKMKLELKRVRDEFKMSESDCGSSRVQVALLTTKIKHLSTALHKKDKHSRKGLQAMVQKRKKLLKYMRRTDWDSYCLVLSKLGLRDNPDYKN